MKRVGVYSAFFVFWLTVISAYEIRSRENAYRENIRKLTIANNELAFNLHRRLVNGYIDGNVFFSPFSISTLFAILFYGARGGTAEELRKTLGYERADLSNILVHDTFHSYLREGLRRGNSSDGYVLNAANAVLVSQQYGLLDEYRRNVQELYGAVYFGGHDLLSVQKVNDYVKENTNGKVNDVLGILDPDTVLVLLNAVYFKGTWKTKFDPRRTNNETFYNKGLESYQSTVPFMHLRSQFPYASLDTFQALELPYKGETASMLILLPKQRDGLHELEESLTPEMLGDIQRRLYTREVEVSLPKFKLHYERDLSPEMQALGAKEIFGNRADFSGMTSENHVNVSRVYHETVVEVNEEGSEAIAKIRSFLQVMSSTNIRPPKFRADHPFLFAILEKSSRSSMILFLGRVNNLEKNLDFVMML